MSRESKAERIKSHIIVNVLDFIDTKQNQKKLEAISQLKEFSKFYNVPLRTMTGKPDIMKSLKEFILNRDGYNETIINLYRSLT